MEQVRYWLLTAVVAIVAVLSVGSLQAQADFLGRVEIDGCQTITEPGSYLVVANMTATGNCIVIMANFVTINLGGFVITGPGNGTGSGIFSSGGHKGIRVSDGTVTNFNVGVQLGTGAVIERVRAVGNSFGFIVNGGTVRDSVAQENSVGIEAFGSSVVGNAVLANSVGLNLFCPGLVLENIVTGSNTNSITEPNLCTIANNAGFPR